MPKHSAVLDACVLIPQYLRDTLLSVAWKNLYHPYWSESILKEANRNLVIRYQMNPEKAEKLIEKMKEAFPEAMVEVPLELIELMENDSKDRHILATAVTAQVEIIAVLAQMEYS